jgi:hypothetical protein
MEETLSEWKGSLLPGRVQESRDSSTLQDSTKISSRDSQELFEERQHALTVQETCQGEGKGERRVVKRGKDQREEDL